MKPIIVFFLSMLIATTGCADNIVIDNQISNFTHHHKSNIAIQWAKSAKNIEASNRKMRQGLTWHSDPLKFLTQKGKIYVNIPQKVEYFRIIVWSKGTGDPDFLTNWVNIIPNKTYTLQIDHLIPVALMAGTGC